MMEIIGRVLVLALGKMRLGITGVVGGKSDSLGRMIQQMRELGINVPGGFTTTADAFRAFLEYNNLTAKIKRELDGLDVSDVKALRKSGKKIRHWIESGKFPLDLETALWEEFARRDPKDNLKWAVRSSATTEDLKGASSAGQQETFLFVRGFEGVKSAVRRCMASLFTDRAIAYRSENGQSHDSAALAACVQLMVNSSASGVIFTLDTESGNADFVYITSSWGVGEAVVGGQVNPDEYWVYKPSLRKGFMPIVKKSLGTKLVKSVEASARYRLQTGHNLRLVSTNGIERVSFSLSDSEVIGLAKQALAIEDHYSKGAGKPTPMDIEWARDEKGDFFIVQARPETVHSGKEAETVFRLARLDEVDKTKAKVAATGLGVGTMIRTGPVKIIRHLREMDRVQKGDILVTTMTGPDWVPAMVKCAAMITEEGGRTCHAAVVGRELKNQPAIVVACHGAMHKLKDGEMVTVSAVDGRVFRGELPIQMDEFDLTKLPKLPVKLKLILGNPNEALNYARLPSAGVGLARMEFILAQMLGVHPQAIVEFDRLPASLKQKILKRSRGYVSPMEWFIQTLAQGIATMAAAFGEREVILRLSDFKSDEYEELIGGKLYERKESNPMIGFRGACRYGDPDFAECFELECEAVRRVIEEMGIQNLTVMIPFVRTTKELDRVLERMASHGLRRGQNGLKLFIMGEIPANAILADKFMSRGLDGVSIGSNDLTQGMLMLSRNEGRQSMIESFQEDDEAVKAAIEMIIAAAKARGLEVGICGQGPSDKPEFALWLLQQGIDSISLNPDVFLKAWAKLAEMATDSAAA